MILCKYYNSLLTFLCVDHITRYIMMLKKKLIDILKNVSIEHITFKREILDLKAFQKKTELFISHIACDSREVQPDGLFVAISGQTVNGHDFVKQASQKAFVLVLDSRFLNTLCIPTTFNGFVIWVKNTHIALSQIAFQFFAHPHTKNIKYIGVTGTNGKTTSVYILEALLKSLGEKVGVLSTIDHHVDGQTWPSYLTTPNPIILHQRIFQMCEKKITTLVMEVSSQALSQYRVHNLKFSAVLWTNLTQDHLDYHISMQSYFKAKKRLFSDYLIKPEGVMVINKDDPWGQKLLKEFHRNVITYSYKNKADLQVLKSISTPYNLKVELMMNRKSYSCSLQLTGKHNAMNFAGCTALLVKMGYSIDDIVKATPCIKNIPGRLELVVKKTFYGFVDYAHTGDALKQTLKSLYHLKPYPHSRIITVFGCGGSRDKTKRSIMAEIAEEYSDVVIITSDNPRNEDPKSILDEIAIGLKNTKQTFIIVDRREAILKGVSLVQKDDILLVAGKGHEQYQIFQTKKVAFSDKKEIQKAIKKLL